MAPHKLLFVDDERDLLEKTLRDSIEMLTEALSLANPLIFGRSARLSEDMADLAQRMRIDSTWELETAAMLCEVGLLTQSDSIIQKIVRHDAMTQAEETESHAQAGIGANLVRKVPRLAPVADAGEIARDVRIYAQWQKPAAKDGPAGDSAQPPTGDNHG